MDKPHNNELDVLAVHRKRKVALLSNNDVVPVTHWFDTRGEDCDPMQASVCVCGTEEVGFFVLDLDNFQYKAVH